MPTCVRGCTVSWPLHYAALKRDATVQALRKALGQSISVEAPAPSNGPILGHLVSYLKRIPAIRTPCNAGLEDKLNAAKAAVIAERSARASAEQNDRALRHEIDVIGSCGVSWRVHKPPRGVDGKTTVPPDQTDKRFISVRSASASSLLAALRRPEAAALAEAACGSDPDHHVGRLDDGDRLHTGL